MILEEAGVLKVCGKGYHDAHGGILVTEGEEPRQVPLEDAVKALSELLVDFDFQSPGDRSRALACMITPVLKMGGLLNGYVAVDVAEADQSQAGKTFRQRLTAAIYNEVPSSIAPKNGGVGSLDESFAQALITGKPFIMLDNVRGKVDSAYIESFLTARRSFQARVPYRGEVMIDPARFFVQMTSNGVETTPDFANRSCFVRIRKRQGCVFKTYPQGDVMDHVRAQQAFYLGCVFSIVRHWHEAGKPKTAVTDHDFRDWSQTLDWIVQKILGEAPLLEWHRSAQERVSNPALNLLRTIAFALGDTDRLGVAFQA